MNALSKEKSKHSHLIWQVMGLILCVAIVEQFATDCYVPALPEMMRSFATNPAQIKLTLSLFLFGEALAQPFFGFLSDSYGRRRMFVTGVVIFALSSIVALLATEVHVLLAARLMQGFGAGCGIVLARSMAKDVFPSGAQFSKIISSFSVLVIILQLFSPVVGGYIQHHLGWHYIFGLLALLSTILTALVFFYLPETFAKEHRTSFNITKLWKKYKVVISHKPFWLNILCASSSSSLGIIYITITPFLFQHVLKISVIEFGWLTALVALGNAAGNGLNAKLVEKFGLDRMVKLGIIIMSLSVVVMFVLAVLGLLNIWLIWFPMLFILVGTGFVGSNVVVKALEPFPKLAGGASAIYGGMQFLLIASAGALASFVHTRTQMPLALLLMLFIGFVAVGHFTNIKLAKQS